jgi:type IV pilus biogenesis protein CpaD/CtpE
MKHIVRSNLASKILCITLVTIALAGCAQDSPLHSDDNWHENGVVMQDLAAQLSNPADLTNGHGDMTVPAQAFVTAATSWYTSQSANSGAVAMSALSSGSGGVP